MTMTKKVYDNGLTRFRVFAQGQYFCQKIFKLFECFFTFLSIIYYSDYYSKMCGLEIKCSKN